MPCVRELLISNNFFIVRIHNATGSIVNANSNAIPLAAGVVVDSIRDPETCHAANNVHPHV